jgi:hypothetical protein
MVEGFDAFNIRGAQFYAAKGKDMVARLHQDGFDVYILNFTNNAQSVFRNAATVQAAVRKISTLTGKQVDLMGVSMGGLISRYAAGEAEDRNKPLPLRHLITMDSPHLGAHISNKLQKFIKRLGKREDRYSLDNQAAKEMLSHNEFDYTNTRQSFEGRYYPVMPRLTRNIAVSFSSPQGNPGLGKLWYKVSHPLVTLKRIYLVKEDVRPGSLLPITFTTSDMSSGVSFTNYPKYRPIFVPHKSSLAWNDSRSPFDVLIKSNANHNHDEIPVEILDPLMDQLNWVEQDQSVAVADGKSIITHSSNGSMEYLHKDNNYIPRTFSPPAGRLRGGEGGDAFYSFSSGQKVIYVVSHDLVSIKKINHSHKIIDGSIVIAGERLYFVDEYRKLYGLNYNETLTPTEVSVWGKKIEPKSLIFRNGLEIAGLTTQGTLFVTWNSGTQGALLREFPDFRPNSLAIGNGRYPGGGKPIWGLTKGGKTAVTYWNWGGYWDQERFSTSVNILAGTLTPGESPSRLHGSIPSGRHYVFKNDNWSSKFTSGGLVPKGFLGLDDVFAVGINYSGNVGLFLINGMSHSLSAESGIYNVIPGSFARVTEFAPEVIAVGQTEDGRAVEIYTTSMGPRLRYAETNSNLLSFEDPSLWQTNTSLSFGEKATDGAMGVDFKTSNNSLTQVVMKSLEPISQVFQAGANSGKLLIDLISHKQSPPGTYGGNIQFFISSATQTRKYIGLVDYYRYRNWKTLNFLIEGELLEQLKDDKDGFTLEIMISSAHGDPISFDNIRFTSQVLADPFAQEIDCSQMIPYDNYSYDSYSIYLENGHAYECIVPGWCPQLAYKPEASEIYIQAWEPIGQCIGMEEPDLLDCSSLSSYSSKSYSGGDRITENDRVYQCQSWPNNLFCNSFGPVSGTPISWWNLGWEDLGECSD